MGDPWGTGVFFWGGEAKREQVKIKSVQEHQNRKKKSEKILFLF